MEGVVKQRQQERSEAEQKLQYERQKVDDLEGQVKVLNRRLEDA